MSWRLASTNGFAFRKDSKEKRKRKTNKVAVTLTSTAQGKHVIFSFFVFPFRTGPPETLRASFLPQSLSRRRSLPTASGARVISARRHRVPSASSRIVAVRGTLSELPVRPQQTRSDVGAEGGGRLDDEPFCPPESKVGGRYFHADRTRLKKSVPVPSGSAWSVKMADSVEPRAATPFARITTL